MNSRWLRYGPLVFWLGFLFAASTSSFSAGNTSRFIRPLLRWLFPKLSENEIDFLHGIVRKIAHFVGYAILGFLSWRAFATSGRDFVRKHWFGLASLLVVAYSLFDEWHQSFVPTRTGSLYDSAIDIAGGLTMLLVLNILYRRETRSTRKP